MTATNRARSTESRGAPPGVGVLAAIEGAGLITWHLVATPVIGERRLRWGTVGTEATDPLPGDGLVPEPKWSYTLGVDIAAPPERVWPWVAQIGQGRGGFYSYQSLENMLGCDVTNATDVIEAHQHPEVGDPVYLHPQSPPLSVELVDPPTTLVLLGAPVEVDAGGPSGKSTWQFCVRPTPDGSRFLTRGRYDHRADWKSRLAFGRFPIEPVSFVMSRRMMLEIKRLSEQPA